MSASEEGELQDMERSSTGEMRERVVKNTEEKSERCLVDTYRVKDHQTPRCRVRCRRFCKSARWCL